MRTEGCCLGALRADPPPFTAPSREQVVQVSGLSDLPSFFCS